MGLDLLVLIAAIIIAWLVFTWLIKVVKTSINTAVIIALIILLLQLFFGIGPQEVWQQLLKIPETIKVIFNFLYP